MTQTDKDDVFVVWRRSDGYVNATTGMPQDWPGFAFTKLGESTDWTVALALIVQGRNES